MNVNPFPAAAWQNIYNDHGHFTFSYEAKMKRETDDDEKGKSLALAYYSHVLLWMCQRQRESWMGWLVRSGTAWQSRIIVQQQMNYPTLL